MLKDKFISVNISYRNITHYIKLGYNPILNNSLEIDIKHLPTSSHVVVAVICEICKSETYLKYHKYVNNYNRHNFYGCRGCSRQKAAMTSLNKWGVDNYSKTEECRKRVEKTNIDKFGYKTNLSCPTYKENIKRILIDKYGTSSWWNIKGFPKNKFKKLENIKTKKITTSELLYDNSLLNSDYLLYRNECRRLTNRNIKILYKNWDGLDFYTKEKIINNQNLDHNDPNYPTIDHKISIYYGFKNNIPASEISDISNLCITKRAINSAKRSLTDSEYYIFSN